jgi:hypothetical protein
MKSAPLAMLVANHTQRQHVLDGLRHKRGCILSALEAATADITNASRKPQGVADLYAQLHQCDLLLTCQLGASVDNAWLEKIEASSPPLIDPIGMADPDVPVRCVCGYHDTALVMTTMHAYSDGWATREGGHMVFTCHDDSGIVHQCPDCDREWDRRFVVEVQPKEAPC